MRERGGCAPPADPVVPHDLHFRALPATGSTLTAFTSSGHRATVGGRPPSRSHESSSLIGRRLRVDAVEHRLDQQTRLRLAKLFQPGLVGVDAQLPREPGMLLDELGQQLLLPGGDRRARRLGVVCAGGVGGRLQVETEEGRDRRAA